MLYDIESACYLGRGSIESMHFCDLPKHIRRTIIWGNYSSRGKVPQPISCIIEVVMCAVVFYMS